jgi:hypothetical protein
MVTAWNDVVLLLQGPAVRVAIYLNGSRETCRQVLCFAIQDAYTAAFDDGSKGTRNTVLAILTFLVESPQFCEMVHGSQLLKLLARVAATPDVHSPREAEVTPFSMAPDALCHEQYRLIWNILALVCENSKTCRELALDLGFMRVLLLYTNLEAASSAVRVSVSGLLCSPG